MSCKDVLIEELRRQKKYKEFKIQKEYEKVKRPSEEEKVNRRSDQRNEVTPKDSLSLPESQERVVLEPTVDMRLTWLLGFKKWFLRDLAISL